MTRIVKSMEDKYLKESLYARTGIYHGKRTGRRCVGACQRITGLFFLRMFKIVFTNE